MRYYFPKKQKSQRTIEKNKVFEEYGKIISQKKLEKLDARGLKTQKKLFEDELNFLNKNFSSSIVEKKFKVLKNFIDLIDKANQNIKIKCDNLKKKIKIKTNYYKENAWLFPACLVINQITLKEDLEEMINAEMSLYKILEDKNYNELVLFFDDLLNYIKKNFLIYELQLINDNNASGKDFINYVKSKNHIYTISLSFQKIIEELLNQGPEDEGGYYYGLNYSFSEFKKINKVPTYDNLEPEKWKQPFEKFNLCNKSDHNNAEIILNFDEIDYIKKANKYFEFSNYYQKINNSSYSIGTVIDLDFYKKSFDEIKSSLEKNLRKIELINRSRLKRQEKETNQGYVYILKSKGYKGMYKVGSTYNLPEERAEELSGTNVPDPWIVAAKYKFRNAEYYEKLTHRLMNDYRYRRDREFFVLEIDKIKKLLEYLSIESSQGQNKLKISDIKKIKK